MCLYYTINAHICIHGMNKPTCAFYTIMVHINLKELRMLQESGMSLSKLAHHYKVNIFHLNNFIWSHGKRNGTYPVDGSRNRGPVKSKYNYPSKAKLVGLLKNHSTAQTAIILGMPYLTLYKYIQTLDIDHTKTKTLKGPRKPKEAPSILDKWKKEIF